MCVSIYGTDNVLGMYCAGPFCKYLVCDMPTIDKMPHLCLYLMGKEACMARPAGGAVQIAWQLLSPVTSPLPVLWLGIPRLRLMCDIVQ